MKSKSIISLVMLSLLSYQSLASEVCLSMIPDIEAGFNNLKAVPGAIPSQIQIDKEAQGLDRFEFVDDAVVLMDAERFPIFSKKRKTIEPITSLEGFVFQGVHLATRTHRTYHRGVEIFDMELHYRTNLDTDSGADGSTQVLSMFEDPFLPYYFKNFELQPTPFVRDNIEGPTWILKHQEDRLEKWSQHTFLYNSGVNLGSETSLSLFFETDFDNSDGGPFILNWLHNSTSGARIDTCVFFLVSARP